MPLLLVPEIGERTLLLLGPEDEERVLPALEPETEACMLLAPGRKTEVRILLPLRPATGGRKLLSLILETCERMSTVLSFRAANLLPEVVGDDLTPFESSSVGACKTILGTDGAELLFVCV